MVDLSWRLHGAALRAAEPDQPLQRVTPEARVDQSAAIDTVADGPAARTPEGAAQRRSNPRRRRTHRHGGTAAERGPLDSADARWRALFHHRHTRLCA